MTDHDRSARLRPARPASESTSPDDVAMIFKGPDRWPLASTTLGLLLMAAGAADAHALLASDPHEDWRLLVRAELESYGGLWLACGAFPRWAWRVALTAVAMTLICDVVRAAAGLPTRDLWGRVAAGPRWVLGGDLAVVCAVLRWRPSGVGPTLPSAHPGRAAGAVLIAATAGVAIDRSGLGQFPIVATARSSGSSPTPGLVYLTYLPEGYYSSFGRWPLIVSLHGSGESGEDADRLKTAGLPRRLEAGRRIPFVVAAPQSPRGGWDVGTLDALLDEVLETYRIDASRVYLTGYSMGGYGTWALAAAHPERFAAIAPICGGGDSAAADRLAGIPTWAFHGAEDTVVAPEESRKMITALERAGGKVRLTIYPGIGHNSAAKAYADDGLYEWFLTHRLRNGASETDARPRR